MGRSARNSVVEYLEKRRALAIVSEDPFGDRELTEKELNSTPLESLDELCRLLVIDARLHRRDGFHIRAYHGHRNAALIYERLGAHQREVEQLLCCLKALRRIGQDDMMRELAFAVRDRLDRYALPRPFYADFLKELGIICMIHAGGESATAICRRADEAFSLFSDEELGSLGSEGFDDGKYSNRRRLAHLTGLEDLERGLGSCVDVIDELKDGNNARRIASVRYSQLLLFIQHGKKETALAFLKENEAEISAGTKWNQLSLGLLRGFLLHAKGDTAKARKSVERVYKDVVDRGFCPPNHWMAEDESPFMAERILGQDHPLVLDLGSIPMYGAPIFSDEELRMLSREPTGSAPSSVRVQLQERLGTLSELAETASRLAKEVGSAAEGERQVLSSTRFDVAEIREGNVTRHRHLALPDVESLLASTPSQADRLDADFWSQTFSWGGNPVELNSRRAVSLLSILLENGGNLVPNQDLQHALGDAPTIANAKREINEAFHPSLCKNVHSQGYKLLSDLNAIAVWPANPPTVERDGLAQPDPPQQDSR